MVERRSSSSGVVDSAIGRPHMMGLTDAEKEELATWFASLSNHAPDAVLPVPECYKAVIAWSQMYGSDIVDERNEDLKPWRMPQHLVDFWSDVWYASRVGALRAMREQENAERREHGLGAPQRDRTRATRVAVAPIKMDGRSGSS